MSGFLEEVALVSDLDNTNESQDKVLLMTLHSAKGLEFPHVYITGMEDGIFPSAMALNSDDEEAEEEERRLAYAKDDLTLTCSRTRMLRGEVQYNPMSRFVAEIPEELFDSEVPSNRYEDDHPFDRDYSDRGDRYGSSTYGSISSYGNSSYRSGYGGNTYGSISSYGNETSYGSKSSFGSSSYSESSASVGRTQEGGRTARPRLKAVYKKPSTDDAKKPYIAKAGGKGLSSLKKGMPSAPSAPDYGPGDRVRHTKYGEGTVKAVEPGPRDYKVTVQFDEYGQKIMYAAFAKLVRC